MSNTPHIQFGDVRRGALSIWAYKTGRFFESYNIPSTSSYITIDRYETGNYECQWQNNARVYKDDEHWHVSHFCSIGDWASNISDILTDERYDTIPVGRDNECDQILFRYYTRMMLVVSEMVTDFSEIIEEISPKSAIDPRTKISSPIVNIHDLMEYINSVCKHKVGQSRTVGKLHICNHHLPIHFEDDKQKNNIHKPNDGWKS